MIDIHSHILFGVDDGCKTIEDSIKMIESAVQNGINELILTPHFSYMRKFTVEIATIQEKFDSLIAKVDLLGIKVKLYLGREIDETDKIIKLLEDGTCQVMNGTRYILIDFGMNKCDIDEFVYDLVINGYIPIIAHPERYKYVKDIKEYVKWKKTGALIQINASSLMHPSSLHMKRMTKSAIKNKLVDFVASDAHRDPKSFKYVAKAYQKCLKMTDKEYANKIFNHIIK